MISVKSAQLRNELGVFSLGWYDYKRGEINSFFLGVLASLIAFFVSKCLFHCKTAKKQGNKAEPFLDQQRREFF
jgi:hypothetical protein